MKCRCFAGIQKHIAFGALGVGAGYYFDQKRNDYLAKRDAVLRHYIELHPDDFPVKGKSMQGVLCSQNPLLNPSSVFRTQDLRSSPGELGASSLNGSKSLL